MVQRQYCQKYQGESFLNVKERTHHMQNTGVHIAIGAKYRGKINEKRRWGIHGKHWGKQAVEM